MRIGADDGKQLTNCRQRTQLRMSARGGRTIGPGPALEQRFEAVRGRSVDLAAPLSAEDCCVQSMPDASPTKRRLAHTSWFFDVFVLKPLERNVEPFRPEFLLYPQARKAPPQEEPFPAVQP